MFKNESKLTYMALKVALVQKKKRKKQDKTPKLN